jgi:DNA polymerase-1
MNFYDNHVQIDGKHRTRFNQILKTGRLSSVKPNLLNIPRKHKAYRAAMVPDPGFEIIDADYDGQELVIVANLAGETAWLDYIDKGYDLHSKNAELIFGDDWLDATEPGCTYYGAEAIVEGMPMLKPFPKDKPYKKCECKGHVEMRDASKAVSFGSIYGISYFKLAFNLKITEEKAKFILHKFFEICPNIKKMMERFGTYALTEGHIIEPVLGRMRFFDKWKLAVPSEHGTIMRAAFNTPIQSSGSAILKIAFVLLRRWIIHNNHQDNIQLLLPYHDECIAQARPAYVTLAKEKVAHYMKLAASLAGFEINASAKSGMSWLEAH